MRAAFVVMEVVVLLLFVISFAHAIAHAVREKSARWLMFFVFGAAFGLAIEFAFVLLPAASSTHYLYGDFMLDVMLSGKHVPLWVGLGWGTVVYAGNWVAHRLRFPWYLVGVLAALLAMNIDFSLDAIAEQQGFWKWTNVGAPNFFGVPFDNFLGWFFIVSIYSTLAAVGFHLLPNGRAGSSFWVPAAAGAGAFGLMLLVQMGLDAIYTLPHGEVATFLTVFIVAVAFVSPRLLRCPRHTGPEWPVLSVPILMHVVLFVVVMVSGEFLCMPSLLVLMPVSTILGVVAWSWPYHDCLA